MQKNIQELHTLLENPAPKGFVLDGDGNQLRIDRLKPIDKERDRVAKRLFHTALIAAAEMESLSNILRQEVAEFVAKSTAEYGKNIGGKKGNVTLYSLDRRIKIERARQDKLCFNEKLLAAKSMIDECIKRWSKGSNRNLQTIVQGAFKTDSKGRFSAAKVLSLRKHNIDDPDWQNAMKALADAIEVDTTAEYYRVYWRDDKGTYHPLALDLANINNR